jgi:hypothetical protein
VKVGDPPQIVTSGVTVEYNFPENTTSVGKTNFWTYAQGLFNLSSPLPVNTGLAGKGLSGQMDAKADHFTAVGIPLTELRDVSVDPTQTRYPYQLANLVAKDASTGAILATQTVVAPLSTELSCADCHEDGGDATMAYPIAPTGNVDMNILAIHDYLSASLYPDGHKTPLLNRQPVLCAECHSSNALGASGRPGVESLSNAIHNHHKNLDDITPDTAGCYKCHPGPTTQCLRDVMSQNFGMNCTNCHGTMAEVAANPTPWIQEPRCDNAACHGSSYQLNQALYRNSQGHANLYCPACHDSPHAIATSREANDSIKFINLQGKTGTLRTCTACHTAQPSSMFAHTVFFANQLYLPLLSN